MLFNSIEFLIFLPIVFFLYWFVFKRSIGAQNILLIIASYIFYGWWDWRFLILIIISSFVDYFVSIAIDNNSVKKVRRRLLIVSLVTNLGILGVFKYYNFFIDSFVSVLLNLGLQPNVSTLNIILPVGISFYTFQTLSYTIDVYYSKMKPTKDMVAFFAFVCFFPQLVAGPIERAINLLPQFTKVRKFNRELSNEGMRRILWGFFKKVVIADNIAHSVNTVFANPSAYSSVELIFGVFLFAIQIYCDFSGYSDIAIGVARLFGFKLMNNFAFPYFSRDISEFWRRWHISLSSWFRDYVYIPLGGSRVGKPKYIFNIITTFTLSGLWHGANWTFVIWGFLNGLYYLPLIVKNKLKKSTDIVAEGKLFPNFTELIQLFVTFLLVNFAWVFFRADSLSAAIEYLSGIFSSNIFPDISSHQNGYEQLLFVYHIMLSMFLLVIEWLRRHSLDVLNMNTSIKLLRWLVYSAIIILIFGLGNFSETEFIYFQF